MIYKSSVPYDKSRSPDLPCDAALFPKILVQPFLSLCLQDKLQPVDSSEQTVDPVKF